MNVSPYLPHAASKNAKSFTHSSLTPISKHHTRQNILAVSCGSVGQPFTSFQPRSLKTLKRENQPLPKNDASLLMQEINTSSNIEKRLEKEKQTTDISTATSKESGCQDPIFPIKRQRRCPKTIFDS